MTEFLAYFKSGFYFPLDVHQYLLIVFLILLFTPYSFKEWLRVLILIGLFGLGEFLAILSVYYNIITAQIEFVRMILPFTILLTGIYNILYTAGKSNKKESIGLLYSVTVFFGLLHGLSFEPFLHKTISGSFIISFVPILESTLGILIAQLSIVLILLIKSYVLQHFFKVNRRDWILVLSAVLIGVVLPIIVKCII